jgi:hypothetical protein
LIGESNWSNPDFCRVVNSILEESSGKDKAKAQSKGVGAAKKSNLAIVGSIVEAYLTKRGFLSKGTV